MNIKCITLLLFLLAGSALPSDSHPIRLRSLTRRSLAPRPRPVPSPVPSPIPRSLPRPAPLSPQSIQPRIPTSLRSTPVSSVKMKHAPAGAPTPLETTAPTPSKNAPLRTAPTPAVKKVEQFAQKLRDEMDAQERVLNTFITTIKRKHASVEMNLKRVRGILSGLRSEIANATKYVNQYQGEEQTQTTTANVVTSEYTKSRKMYEDEKQNLQFEREFLDAIIRYIKLRKKC